MVASRSTVLELVVKRTVRAQRSVAMGVVGKRLGWAIWLIILCVLTLLGVIGYGSSRLLVWITSFRTRAI